MTEDFKEFLRSHGVNVDNPYADGSRLAELWRLYQYQSQKMFPKETV